MDSVEIAGPSFAYRLPPYHHGCQLERLAQLDSRQRHRTGPGCLPSLGTVDDATNDPAYTNKSLTTMLNTYSLELKEIKIDEYAQYSEQAPTVSEWWTNQPRYTDYYTTDYVAAPEWHVCRYYDDNSIRVCVPRHLTIAFRA
ncbi:hypothetical protein MKZ38_010084 [Zalerion maritima]|uniref:Uncharacterized protein n=1 Tax=Zalerion maritima TaxID=339359 RepID=A0AAD5WSP4_9PEZI|nr:hypothetical protein MKZ38_010084 [Zalerion maritima]